MRDAIYEAVKFKGFSAGFLDAFQGAQCKSESDTWIAHGYMKNINKCDHYYITILLRFADDITWVDAPTEQYPIAGTSYKVRCKVKANPAPLVDWYKEDSRIQDGNRFIKDIDGLMIQNVTAEDDGIYKCRAIVLDTGNILDRDIRVEVRVYLRFRKKK